MRGLACFGTLVLLVGCGGGNDPQHFETPRAPSFTRGLADQEVRAPNGVTFSVEVQGTSPITYKWLKEATVLTADGPTLTLPSTTEASAGSYSVTATNSTGFATSVATLTVKPGQDGPPVILTQPKALTLTVGSPLKLTVEATGTGPLTYQWTRNGVAIPQATTWTYEVAKAALTDAGTYRVTVKGLVAPEALSAEVAVVVSSPGGGAWSTTGSLQVPRSEHTATLLPDGRVLVAGGATALGRTASTEIFDPAKGTWTPGPQLLLARNGHTATLLPDGRILIAGGYGPTGASTLTELLHPTLGSSYAGPLNVARTGHVAVDLGGGAVLVAGGVGTYGVVSSAEVFNPSSQTWVTASSLREARSQAVAALLPDKSVLVAGGLGLFMPLASSERFSAAGGFVSGPAMVEARVAPAQVVLADGSVLFLGGERGLQALATTEVYDPAQQLWRPGPALARGRKGSAAVLLASGKALLAGGSDGSSVLSACELVDLSGSVGAAGLAKPRQGHTLTRLKDGSVLAAGGLAQGFGYEAVAEVFR